MYKKRHSDYICVADGVILDIANRNSDYLNVCEWWIVCNL